MKNPKLLLLLFAVTCLAACKGFLNSGDPVKYNDEIISENEKIEEVFTDFFNALEQYEFERAEKLRLKSIEVSDSALYRLKNLGPFNDEDEFRQAAIKYVEVGKKIAETDFIKITNLYKSLSSLEESEEESAYEEYDDVLESIDRLYETMNSADSVYFANFSNAQKNFAQAHNITLLETKQAEDDEETSIEDLLKNSKPEDYIETE